MRFSTIVDRLTLTGKGDAPTRVACAAQSKRKVYHAAYCGRGRPRVRTTFLLVLVLCASLALAQTRTSKTLDIYVIDVEGGNAVLFVAPSGESMLVDTGNGGDGAVRDAGRIMAAVKDAGVTQIDHLIITHYHNDHIGGLSELATRIPIKEFIDHGANTQPGPNIDPVLARYAELYAHAKHTVAKPGDKIAVSGLDWRIVSAAGEVIKTPLSGAGAPNPYCADFKPADVPKTETTNRWEVTSPSESFEP